MGCAALNPTYELAQRVSPTCGFSWFPGLLPLYPTTHNLPCGLGADPVGGYKCYGPQKRHPRSVERRPWNPAQHHCEIDSRKNGQHYSIHKIALPCVTTSAREPQAKLRYNRLEEIWREPYFFCFKRSFSDYKIVSIGEFTTWRRQRDRIYPFSKGGHGGFKAGFYSVSDSPRSLPRVLRELIMSMTAADLAIGSS